MSSNCLPKPFTLSLSKGCLSLIGRGGRKGQGFDKLSPTGLVLIALFALAACRAEPEAPRFPKADRPVAAIVSDSFSTEDARDRLGEAEANASAASKTDIGWGHQIRSYVLQPYQLVKDLRTGVISTAPGDVLDGDLDRFMAAALSQRVTGEKVDVEDVE